MGNNRKLSRQAYFFIMAGKGLRFQGEHWYDLSTSKPNSFWDSLASPSVLWSSSNAFASFLVSMKLTMRVLRKVSKILISVSQLWISLKIEGFSNNSLSLFFDLSKSLIVSTMKFRLKVEIWMIENNLKLLPGH